MVQPHTHQWIIHIRSKECATQTAGGLNSALSISLKTPIERIPGHEFQISLSSAEIPFSWYNISSRLSSNEIIVSGSPLGVSPSLTLTEGNYDIFELVDTINAANAANQFPFSVVYNTNTNKVTLTNTTVNTRKLNFSQKEFQGLAKMLGFDPENDSPDIPQNQTITSSGGVNMRPIHSLFMHSNLAASNVITTLDGGIVNIIDKIPLDDVNPMENITYNYYDTAPFNSIITVPEVRDFDISLRDQNGNLVDFNGINYELSLLVEQRLAYNFEIDHPSHPYPEIATSRRRSTEKSQTPKPKQVSTSIPIPKQLDPRSPRPQPQPPIQTQPLGGSAITLKSTTDSMPSVTMKRPRIDDEQLQRQELELDKAIMMVSDL